MYNVTVLQLTCFEDTEISSFFCDPSQLLNLGCSDTFMNNGYIIIAISGFPLAEESFSYYKIFVSILRSPHQVRCIKPLPPVALTWHWYACFMEQPWGYISAQPSPFLQGRM